MQFSKLIVGSLLALVSSVASQVVVTVTNTVTVITITVTPLTTSTYTQFTTISSSPPTTTKPSTRTITSTVTYTSKPPTTSATAITTCPIPLYYQCGGDGWSGCTSCAKGATCISQNPFYSQCTTHSPSVVTVTSTVYSG